MVGEHRLSEDRGRPRHAAPPRSCEGLLWSGLVVKRFLVGTRSLYYGIALRGLSFVYVRVFMEAIPGKALIVRLHLLGPESPEYSIKSCVRKSHREASRTSVGGEKLPERISPREFIVHGPVSGEDERCRGGYGVCRWIGESIRGS